MSGNLIHGSCLLNLLLATQGFGCDILRENNLQRPASWSCQPSRDPLVGSLTEHQRLRGDYPSSLSRGQDMIFELHLSLRMAYQYNSLQPYIPSFFSYPTHSVTTMKAESV